jgi:P pilus assembly chaperone PapD
MTRLISRLVQCAMPVLLLLPVAVNAAEFQLSPTRVQLDPKHLVDTVVVGNSGAAPLRFEVSVKRWTMAADGSWVLVPSDDLIVHPLMLEIAPGSRARLRVGQLVPSHDPAEAGYRIELDEQADGEHASNSVRMLTRISLPVFVDDGDEGAPAATLASAQWQGDALNFALHNGGDRYLPPQALDVQLVDAGGTPLAKQSLQGNYVLAGATLPVRMHLPRSLCERANELRVHLQETGTQLHLPLSPRHCRP